MLASSSFSKPGAHQRNEATKLVLARLEQMALGKNSIDRPHTLNSILQL